MMPVFAPFTCTLLTIFRHDAERDVAEAYERAVTCTPARTTYVRAHLRAYNDDGRVHPRLKGPQRASSRFPRGSVYRTARQGGDNGPIERMEGHLGYASRDAFDFFKDGEQRPARPSEADARGTTSSKERRNVSVQQRLSSQADMTFFELGRASDGSRD